MWTSTCISSRIALWRGARKARSPFRQKTGVAEIFSPPHLFIDPNRRATISALAPVAEPRGYRAQSKIGGKTFVLLHTDYTIQLGGLPTSCPVSARSSVVLIKLSSATHGWENGKEFYDLPFSAIPGSENRIAFRTPNAKTSNIPPAY